MPPLTDAEVGTLGTVFPELDWMSREDWQTVAEFAHWNLWVDNWSWQEDFREGDRADALERMLKLRENRVQVRKDCRHYYGIANVPNINDPGMPTWA